MYSLKFEALSIFAVDGTPDLVGKSKRGVTLRVDKLNCNGIKAR